MIKDVMHDMSGNISEARGKIMTAYRYRDKYPGAAAWYKEMALAHLNFNNSAAALVKKHMDEYKTGERYKANPAYADGMIQTLEEWRADMNAKAAEVRCMIDSFK